MLDILLTAVTGIAPLAVAGPLAVIASLWLLGRLVAGRDLPDLATVCVGWGAAVLAMTLLGTVFGRPLWPLLPALGAAAAFSAWREARARKAPDALRAVVLVLPLALLVSGRSASEWDEFSHWMAAFRYLHDFALLPAKGAPAIESCCAAYPYGWPLLGMLASRLVGFSEGIPGVVNVLLLALAGDLVARALAGDRRPGWSEAGWGVLLVSLLGTTFVTKLAFTAYADVSTGVTLLAAVWVGWRLAERCDLGHALCFGLVGAALVAQKPSNLVLYVLALGAAALLVLRLRARSLGRGDLVAAILAVAPVLLAWAAWRAHVQAHLSGEEQLVVRPFAEWNLHLAGAVLAGMAEVASNKGGYFGVMLATTAIGLAALVRPSGPGLRLALMVAAAFLGYNAFLFFSYVAIFLPADAERVASFWRYNTHLGLLASLMVALGAGHLLRRSERAARWAGKAAWLPLVLALAGPVAAVKSVRFDLDPAKRFLRGMLAQVPAAGASSICLIDPRGSGLSHVMASYEWRGQPAMTRYTTGFMTMTPDGLRDWCRAASHLLVVSWDATVTAAWPALSAGPHAVLAEREGRVLATWPYPGNREPKAYP